MTTDLTLTVLGTTDLHGNVFNWDYVHGGAYADVGGNAVGLARCASLIRQVRAERGSERCITLDAGDTIQGTLLAHYFARVDPVTEGAVHPMAAGMNALGYDAAALGNHEFNYGMDVLRAFQRQLDFPLLGANAVDWETGEPTFPPFVIRTIEVDGLPPLRVGILGLVTPGVAVWDRANVEGQVRFPGIVEQAARFVPILKSGGADLVVVSCHSGMDADACSYGDQIPHAENVSTLLARQVPGIDAILVGHAHVEIAERVISNEVTGRAVLLSEPLCWGMRVSVMNLELSCAGGTWRVVKCSAELLRASDAQEDRAVAEAVRAAHETVVRYADEVIAVSSTELSSAAARYRQSRVVDLVNRVQAEVLREALVGTESEGLPIFSVTSPFNRASAIPAGVVTVRDLTGVYVHESTLVGVRMTGAELHTYLERSAEYFRQVAGPGPFAPDEVTGAVTAAAPHGTPDYNYDILGAFDAPVAYDIDVSRPCGQRIRALTYAGHPVDPDCRLVLAVNSYRQAGGGHYPVVTKAPVVHDARREIRQLLIDWVRAVGRLEPDRIPVTTWRLVAGDEPVEVSVIS
ncbi:bifunctional metallophosphatase/5'-nucleotidase [Leekyejoonella antrihumi]|uniref:Bifunctional metallophosphatase/5'-nucleotidase n=1 Tax=Leekyejoonella antrihumi TaxID=1660198 RepID=A0A563DZP9_9MICO|nr:5'-nucleotidase C-terminal domain-containing protein [Leekyejoonella antrihumi]TWP35706.1 bifunctional metallophosphatase/5'-nucleotidase [Leekyejoonella antrihumi]